MRTRVSTAALVFVLGSIGLVTSAGSDEPHTNAPTGVYFTDIPERITVELKTDGTYSASATGYSGTNNQTGIWKWDASKQQFSLTPGTNGGTFRYRLRLLRVDPQNRGTLQWIPPRSASGEASAVKNSALIDYVRFKRRDP